MPYRGKSENRIRSGQSLVTRALWLPAFVWRMITRIAVSLAPAVTDGDVLKEADMYIARFSYAVLPINRQRAIDFIRREVQSAQRNQLNARLLVPLTRGQGDPALQFEVELTNLE